MRLLILGGTTEASTFVRRIAGRRDLDPVLSFAGRTRSPEPPPIPFRVGGFGHLLFFGQGGFLDHADTVANITLMAKEVLPRLQELNPAPKRAAAVAAQ